MHEESKTKNITRLETNKQTNKAREDTKQTKPGRN